MSTTPNQTMQIGRALALPGHGVIVDVERSNREM